MLSDVMSFGVKVTSESLISDVKNFPSLKLTASLHLKMDVVGRRSFCFLKWGGCLGLFSGANLLGGI